MFRFRLGLFLWLSITLAGSVLAFTPEQEAEIRRIAGAFQQAGITTAKGDEVLELFVSSHELRGAIRLPTLEDKLGLNELKSKVIYQGAPYLHVGTLHTLRLGVEALRWDVNTINDPNWSYPSGTVVRYENGLYQAARDIRSIDYYPWNVNCGGPTGTCVYPIPGQAGTGTNWLLLVEDGADGPAGPQGPRGLDGVGGIHFGEWNPSTYYTNGTDWVTIVEYNGAWYRLLTNNAGLIPAIYTNYWAVSVDKGRDGTYLGTNFLYRGDWRASEAYTNFDVVTYNYNLFVVDPTNVPPPVGTAPQLNANGQGVNSEYWTCLLRRGEPGVQGPPGPKGDPGTVITNITYYTWDTWTNLAKDTLSETSVLWAALGTNASGWVFGFRSDVPVGSNILTATDGKLYLNGALVGGGGGGTGTDDWARTEIARLDTATVKRATFSVSGNTTSYWDHDTQVLYVYGDGGGIGAGDDILFKTGAQHMAAGAGLWIDWTNNAGLFLKQWGGGSSTGALRVAGRANIAGVWVHGFVVTSSFASISIHISPRTGYAPYSSENNILLATYENSRVNRYNVNIDSSRGLTHGMYDTAVGHYNQVNGLGYGAFVYGVETIVTGGCNIGIGRSVIIRDQRSSRSGNTGIGWASKIYKANLCNAIGSLSSVTNAEHVSVIGAITNRPGGTNEFYARGQPTFVGATGIYATLTLDNTVTNMWGLEYDGETNLYVRLPNGTRLRVLTE